MWAHQASSVAEAGVHRLASDVHMLERPRLVRHMSVPARVTVVVAPAGYGKTVAVRQWVDHDVRDCSWATLDLIDDSPDGFWRDLITAVRALRPDIDHEPDALLERYGPADARFLASLLEQLEASSEPGVLVLDEISRLTDATSLAGLALLVDRLGPEIQLVLIGRVEPALPVARWRSQGLLCEVGEEHLRFTDVEAVAAVAALSNVELPASSIVALSARIEGWPAGVHLALLAIRDAADPVAAVERVAGSGRLFSSYLVAEVLEKLPADELQVALALSVVDEFDAALCAELLGPAAVPMARALLHRGLFLSRSSESDGALRFHPVFLEVLREELLWRDPLRRIELHRRAADICKARGDLNGAYRHLNRIVDRAAVTELLLGPALKMVVAGDRRGVGQLMRSFPADLEVESQELALDVAAGWMMTGDRAATVHWCDRADELAEPGNMAAQAQGHVLRCGAALLSGDLALAIEHIAQFGHATHTVRELAEFDHFAAMAVRVMLASERMDDAAEWAEQLRSASRSTEWIAELVPVIDGWLAWAVGDLRRATDLSEAVVAKVAVDGGRGNNGVFDAMYIAAWCRLAKGDLHGAHELADAVVHDARLLNTPWHRLRAGVLQAEVRRLTRGPRAALDSVGELRRLPDIEGSPHAYVRRELDFAEAAALIELGALAPATRLIESHADGARKRLLLARAASRYETLTTVEEILGVRAGWTVPQQLEADLLLARAGSASDCHLLTEALTTAGATGWILPFLGHGQAVEDFIAGHALARLHPKLHAVLSQRREGTTPSSLHVELTARELTVLRLLSTHLSYAEIAARLYLSVNTVKTNLKSLYRKLGVASRSEAVEAATRAGIS